MRGARSCPGRNGETVTHAPCHARGLRARVGYFANQPPRFGDCGYTACCTLYGGYRLAALLLQLFRMQRKFAILTSGGDAPGMNAAIRSVVRTACALGHEVVGVNRGFAGLLTADFRPLGPNDVSLILEKGGTFLRTSRCADFRETHGLLMAAAALERAGIDILIAIGGDGTLTGCQALAPHWPGIILGLPGTIDNDLWGTDATIGFDTAVNTALQAIEKIRDTADSHERSFLVEVMGRHAGFIALRVAITCGAEEFLVPEIPVEIGSLCARLQAGRIQGKAGSVVVVAEGAYPGGVHALALEMARHCSEEFRICVLGHIQRGGSPSAADRLLATRLGAYAVEAALAGETGKMIGERAGRPVLVDLGHAVARKKPLDPWTVRMAPSLSLA
jgi:6-phosphofructokinase 1